MKPLQTFWGSGQPFFPFRESNHNSSVQSIDYAQYRLRGGGVPFEPVCVCMCVCACAHALVGTMYVCNVCVEGCSYSVPNGWCWSPNTSTHTFDNNTRMPTYKGPCVCFCSRRTLTSRKCRNNAVRTVGGIFLFLFFCNVLQCAIFAEAVVT